MAGNDRVIVGCSHGAENPDGVVVSYLTVHDQFIDKGGRSSSARSVSTTAASRQASSWKELS